MKDRDSRWMRWILTDSALDQPAPAYARGPTRAAFIERRAADAGDARAPAARPEAGLAASPAAGPGASPAG